MSLIDKNDFPSKIVLFCVNIGLLKSEWSCRFCRNSMSLALHHREDGWIWVWWKHKCKKYRKPVRSDSLLANIKLPLFKIVMIMYERCQKTIIKQIKHEYNVDWGALNTVFTTIRKVIIPRKIVKIGGIGEIVEVD
ncbi:hypothetical protein CDIK_3233 [Cucumispora dikerogammari]|nr:hypothetical protein CDIK_3233 [Cucumispora dikerogammari]